MTFTGESATGWQEADFATPVAVSANTTYLVSYYAPNGHYASSEAYWKTSGSTQGPIRALADGVDGPNGVYSYGGDAFPSTSFDATNYYVDAVFTTSPSGDTTPPTVIALQPTAGTSSVSTSVVVGAAFSEVIQPSTVSFTVSGPNGPVAGSTSSLWGVIFGFTPTGGLAPGTTYTATVSGAKDLAGNTMTSPTTWTFRTAYAPNPPGVCPCSLWNDTVVPSMPNSGDTERARAGRAVHLRHRTGP